MFPSLSNYKHKYVKLHHYSEMPEKSCCFENNIYSLAKQLAPCQSKKSHAAAQQHLVMPSKITLQNSASHNECVKKVKDKSTCSSNIHH